ncbi:MAG: tetratricopeptide repeat protein, partial [Bradyrhizobium sp.]|nr:tetratricopeptide repeat protein [Bradyrhizobium sp.]
RLRELDARLTRSSAADETINLEIERAVLLAALNRHQEAQAAFVAILRKAPTHFSALNEFGTLLTKMGAIEAACRVYAEAILHHPDNPLARVNLANLLLRATRYHEAREHYERALQADPDHAEAHQGLGAVLADLGDRDGAREHFRQGFRGRAVSTLPYRGDKPPIPLLQLVSSGGGNIPSALFLDDTCFLISVVVADYYDFSTPLPPHRLIFNAIGDADLCGPALEAAMRIVAGAKVPVINDPGAVMHTGRSGNAERLRGIDGVCTAQTKVVARDALAGADGPRLLSELGFAFPLLLRSPGYHTGRNFVLVERAAALAAAAAELPGEELLAIEYLDARGSDGSARKFRVMMIDGALYPLHLAVSQDWKVHYFTSDMADLPDHRTEEAKFLQDMPAVLGPKAMGALKAIQVALGLDYAGIDFGLSPDGDLLLFEANATMVIAKPNDDERWAYRRKSIDRAVEAVTAMLKRKAAAPSLPLPHATGVYPGCAL